MACGILVQLFNGYTKFELGQYFFALFVLQLAGLLDDRARSRSRSTSVVNHKYLGHFLVVLYYIVESHGESASATTCASITSAICRRSPTRT